MTSDQAWEPRLRPTTFPNKDSSSKKHNFLPMEGSPFWKWVFTSRVWAAPCLGIREVLGFPRGSDGKEFTCNARDLGLIPGLGRSPGGWHGNTLQYSCLENPMDRIAWEATVYGVAKSRIQLNMCACICMDFCKQVSNKLIHSLSTLTS